MTQNEIIERIKKFLALSSDGSTTQHERDLALNRAKELMARHSLEDVDLQNKTIDELIVSEDYSPKLDNPLPSYLFNPALFNAILQPICNNFGCYCSFYIIHKSGQSIMGFKTNIEIAKYACDVLINQGIKDFRAEYKNVRSVGFAVTFWNGFAEGIARRFTKLSDETAMVLYDKVKMKFNESIRTMQFEMPNSTEASGHSAGIKSATNAQLNTAISQTKGNLLK